MEKPTNILKVSTSRESEGQKGKEIDFSLGAPYDPILRLKKRKVCQMKVILQENVDNLGYVGDILDVANGYARNYLLPRGLASEANLRNVKSVEHAKRVAAHKSKQVEHGLKEEAEKLSAVSVSIPMQTGKDDKLFGSVTAKDIEAALLVEGFEVDRRKIQLPHPLKELGTTEVSIKLFRDISAQISVTVVKKGGQTASTEDSQEAEDTGTSEELDPVESGDSESQEEE